MKRSTSRIPLTLQRFATSILKSCELMTSCADLWMRASGLVAVLAVSAMRRLLRSFGPSERGPLRKNGIAALTTRPILLVIATSGDAAQLIALALTKFHAV